ncbi:MAG TPA: hypothetical protein DD456_03085 [Stenotrophomonas sp.]|nr:hypothetical protein [Stenotrophomonas sp.]
MKRFFPLALAAGLAGCAQRIDPAPQPGQVYQLPAIEWHVVDRDELRRIYAAAGMPLAEGDKLHGFAGVDGAGRPVIYTLVPARVDDAATLTLGHELLHVALGRYHPE